MSGQKLNFLCIASFYKGGNFLEGIKENGHNVYLLTSQKLKEKNWPWHAIDETFYMPQNDDDTWNIENMLAGVAWLLKKINIDRVVALDDFDVEKGTLIREEFRIPGMGQSTGRYFRDKLAMRIRANDAGIPVPQFTSIFNDVTINNYLDRVEGPWLIKPRAEASATGIQKVYTKEDAWDKINALEPFRHNYLIESFRPGDVFHVDGICFNGEVVFSRASRYLNTPFDVAHNGGIFRTQTLNIGDEDEKILQKINADVMKAFRMEFSAFHSEYIKGHDGNFYFLETSSRVGGAHIAECVEAATGVDLWKEWANVEIAAHLNEKYKVPKSRKDQAGVIISLSRVKEPNTSIFNDKEVVEFIKKDYHVGMIIKSSKAERITELLEKYFHLIHENFHASAPAPKKATS